jgi:hypothetical protein
MKDQFDIENAYKLGGGEDKIRSLLFPSEQKEKSLNLDPEFFPVLESSSTPSSNPGPSEPIISVVYKCLTAWSDDYSSIQRNTINELNNAISLYEPSGQILTEDKANLDNNNKELKPMPKFVKNIPTFIGGNNSTISDNVTATAQSGKGGNLYEVISNTRNITNSISSAKVTYLNDRSHSDNIMEIKKTANIVFPALDEMRGKYLMVCEMLDIYLFSTLNRTNRKYSELLIKQYKVFRPDTRNFDRELEMLRLGVGSPLGILLKLNRKLDPNKMAKIGVFIVKHTEMLKRYWSVYQKFYKITAKAFLLFIGKNTSLVWNERVTNIQKVYSDWFKNETEFYKNVIEKIDEFMKNRNLNGFIDIISKPFEDANNENALKSLEAMCKEFEDTPS